MTWNRAFELLDNFLDLPSDLVRQLMREILEGRAEKEDLKRFLLALKEKGETSDEVGAMVAEMYEHSAPITITERAVDIVGTGGDQANTINISTMSAIVAAAAGAVVVKHGNRAASSKSGSADLLEALGVAINLDGQLVAQCVAELRIGFCFAPNFHPAMRHAAPARKELGVPTVFNILGPLANPAKPKSAAIGVANDRMHLVMAQVLGDRGVDGFVFRGDDGLDELTLTTTTQVLTIGNGEIESGLIDPPNFGISYSPIEKLVGGDANQNAEIALSVFKGEVGAPRDAVILNSAAAIAAYNNDAELDLQTRFVEAIVEAKAAIDSGAALDLLNRWVKLTQAIAKS
ncbi:MAG: anthranilate phosphoribosyltransferase [Candidatus Nanopelagicaceae bacterium]